MKEERGVDMGQHPPEPREACVVALGNFDGVHIGHQTLIEQGLKQARRLGVRFKVLLFAPHPQKVLHPERVMCFLTGLEEKKLFLAELGVDEVLVSPFTREFAEMTPEAFVFETLVPLRPVHVVVGYNYTFGRRACGGTAELEKLGKTWGFAVDVVPEQKIHGMRMSSSDIRQALSQGNVEAAGLMLGRPYQVAGCVEKGLQRGRELGFPTANLSVSRECVVPGTGVYAGKAFWQGASWGAVINIGLCPTFSDPVKKVRVEVHILGFHGDLYGERLAVDFVARLRPEKRFESGALLAEQIREDIASAEGVLFGPDVSRKRL